MAANCSVVLVVPLKSQVVHNGVALDVRGRRAVLHDHWGPVEVHAIIDHEQRVVVVNDIIIDTDTIQVLLQQVLKEEVLLLECRLLFLDSELVKMDLVIALIEVIKLLEFVVGVRIDAHNLFNPLIRLLLCVRVRLVERQDLFLLSFKLTAEFCSLEDALSQLLIASKCFHTLQTVGNESAKMILLLGAQFGHFPFQIVVVSDDRLFFPSQ